MTMANEPKVSAARKAAEQIYGPRIYPMNADPTKICAYRVNYSQEEAEHLIEAACSQPVAPGPDICPIPKPFSNPDHADPTPAQLADSYEPSDEGMSEYMRSVENPLQPSAWLLKDSAGCEVLFHSEAEALEELAGDKGTITPLYALAAPPQVSTPRCPACKRNESPQVTTSCPACGAKYHYDNLADLAQFFQPVSQPSPACAFCGVTGRCECPYPM